MGNLNFQLIDFGPIADVTNNLINKLAKAIGWVATKPSLNTVAMNTYIDEIQKSDDPPLLKAAKISTARKTLKEYINQNNIVAIATQNIGSADRIEAVDNDWLVQFMEMAKLISDDEFQKIWGKILADECSNPGSIPKSVLFVLQKMDKDDAICFTKLGSLVIKVCGEETPFITRSFFNGENEDEERIYKESGVTFDNLTQFEALGLLKFDPISISEGFATVISKDYKAAREVRYFEESMLLGDDINTIPIANVIFTKDGQGLYRAIHPNKLDDFWEKVVRPEIDRKLQYLSEEEN